LVHLGEVGFDRLGPGRAAEQVLLLALEVLDLAEQIPDGLVAGEVGPELGVLALEIRDPVMKPLVLLEQLLRELRALAEELLNEPVALLLEILRGAIARRRRAPFHVRHRGFGSSQQNDGSTPASPGG